MITFSRDRRNNRLKNLAKQEAIENVPGTCGMCYTDFEDGLKMDECDHMFCKDCFIDNFEYLIE